MGLLSNLIKKKGKLFFCVGVLFYPNSQLRHSFQDQVVSIVTEVLEANVSNTLVSETDRVCHLLLVILETSLYMELCVSQSCGIRPVLGRFEDFSKGIKAMLHGMLLIYTI
jgi:nuclear pore complex protein Nup188